MASWKMGFSSSAVNSLGAGSFWQAVKEKRVSAAMAAQKIRFIVVSFIVLVSL